MKRNSHLQLGSLENFSIFKTLTIWYTYLIWLAWFPHFLFLLICACSKRIFRWKILLRNLSIFSQFISFTYLSFSRLKSYFAFEVLAFHTRILWFIEIWKRFSLQYHIIFLKLHHIFRNTLILLLVWSPCFLLILYRANKIKWERLSDIKWQLDINNRRKLFARVLKIRKCCYELVFIILCFLHYSPACFTGAH